MKNIVFLSLLVGLTACNLTSLRVVEDAPAGGDISGDINLPTGEVPVTNFVEYTNKVALDQFNVDVTDLTQYNSNQTTTTDIVSVNWYFDNTTNPSKVVNTFLVVNIPKSMVTAQRLNSYTVTQLPSNRFTSYAIRSASNPTDLIPVQLSGGGMFLELRGAVGQERYHNNDGTLGEWTPTPANSRIIVWVKFFGNFAWVVGGGAEDSSDSSRFIFSNDPNTAVAFTSK